MQNRVPVEGSAAKREMFQTPTTLIPALDFVDIKFLDVSVDWSGIMIRDFCLLENNSQSLTKFDERKIFEITKFVSGF